MLNYVEYMIEHQGEEVDWREVTVVTVSGAIEGGISFGIGGLGVGFVGNIVASTVGDMVGGAVSSAVESVGQALLGNTEYDYGTSAFDSLVSEPSIGLIGSVTAGIVSEAFLTGPAKVLVEPVIDVAVYVISKTLTSNISDSNANSGYMDNKIEEYREQQMMYR